LPPAVDDEAVAHTLVELRPVTADNWRACTSVTPTSDQESFVAPVSYYLTLCHYGGVWQPLAVYADGQVVGFAMWGLDDADGSHWIGGLVVDRAQQGRGLGKAAVAALLRFVAAQPDCRQVALSYQADNHRARALYAAAGFRESGEVSDDEVVARLDAARLDALRPARPPRPADTLGMDPTQMRRLGRRVVDLVVDHVEQRATGPAMRTAAAADLQAVLGGSLPEEPSDPDEALTTLAEVALSAMQHGDHPRYLARIPSPASYAAILGEWLATGHNAIATSWTGGSGPATVELVVIEWLREMLGMPEGTQGVLLSGGSMASLTAFAAARAVGGPGVAYLSDQTHASLTRDLVTLAFPAEHIRVLPSDDAFRLPVHALAEAVAEDRAAGRQPLLAVASAGTTNTGAVDPLPDIADLCDREGMWFHVDGAYGAPAALCAAGRPLLAGMDRADSLVVDPHKWLFQPYDVGCLLVRRPGALEAAFAMDPEYLRDVRATHGEVDFRDRSLELTRRARALKLWLMFRVHGARQVRDAVARGIALAEAAEAMLRADPRWEVVTPAQLGIVTFALRGADAAGHVARAAALAASGVAAVTSTTLRGRSVLRLCTINPTTTEADLRTTLAALAD